MCHRNTFSEADWGRFKMAAIFTLLICNNCQVLWTPHDVYEVLNDSVWYCRDEMGSPRYTKRLSNIHTLPAKKWNIFYFSDYLHFCGVCRVFLYLKYIPTSRYYFGGSYLALNSKMKHKGSKTIISVFFSIRLWLEFLLSLCQFAGISIRVLY